MAEPIPFRMPGGVPGGGIPGAAPPPGMGAGGPSNVGPAVSPQGNPGNQAAALQKVKLASSALQEALPALPMGSEAHTKLLKIVGDLAKLLQGVHEDPQAQIQALMQMIRNAPQAAQMSSLAKMGQPAGAPPAMPSPTPAPAPAGADAAAAA